MAIKNDIIYGLLGAILGSGCYANNYIPETTKTVNGAEVTVETDRGCKPTDNYCSEPTNLTMKVVNDTKEAVVFVDLGFNPSKPSLDIVRLGRTDSTYSLEYKLSEPKDADVMAEAQEKFENYWTGFQSADARVPGYVSKGKEAINKF